MVNFRIRNKIFLEHILNFIGFYILNFNKEPLFKKKALF